MANILNSRTANSRTACENRFCHEKSAVKPMSDSAGCKRAWPGPCSRSYHDLRADHHFGPRRAGHHHLRWRYVHRLGRRHVDGLRLVVDHGAVAALALFLVFAVFLPLALYLAVAVPVFLFVVFAVVAMVVVVGPGASANAGFWHFSR